MTELVKVDPKEYGLEEVQVLTIEQAFLPKIAERDGYAQIYEQLITKELTPSLCSEAADLRKKLVKTRTGIAEIHKTQKAFFLSAGRYVDAWKNKETLPIEQMEEKLSEIEKYFENIEKERIAKLDAERTTEISKYSEVVPHGLGSMNDQVYENYLKGCIVAYEAKIKAEQELEAERLRLIEVEKEAARLKAIEDERIRVENEKLKAEAEAREKEIEAERKRQADLLAKQKGEADEKEKQRKELVSKRSEELRPYIVFIRNYSAMIELSEPEYQKEFSEVKKGAELQWESDRKESVRKQQEQEKAEAERKRLSDELKAKEESDRKAKEESDRKEAERISAEQKAAKAPRKQKLNVWIDGFVLGVPSGLNDDNTVLEILKKFEWFKNWAKSEIEKL